ncbi:MAG: phosphoglycerate dehydrogenase [Bdellovibrionales bacterium]|nr:phosphoglycerate dehydrogenase [Bdellovibrionales bacterium]
MKILVADKISAQGLKDLEQLNGVTLEVKTGLSEEELIANLAGVEALLVRSQTKVTENMLNYAQDLRLVARAGQGCDNIDIEAATKRGVAVMNTPAKNSSAAAEHAVAMMFALSRNIPQAHRDLTKGLWERSKYMGVELVGKTLGLVGLGNVGRQVAWRALGLKMKVLAYDPFVTSQAMGQIDVVKATMEEITARADYISLHMTLNEDTKHMINEDVFSKMKPGMRLVNCARGGLIDEAALLKALEKGIVQGAALDVFETEPPTKDNPILNHPKIILTPHLGASTHEAQEEVMKAIIDQIDTFVQTGVVINGINVPQVTRELMLSHGSYFNLAEKLGQFMTQLENSPIEEVSVECFGELIKYDLSPVTTSVLYGLMQKISSDSLNFVSALVKAKEKGIRMNESTNETPTGYASMVRVTGRFKGKTHSISGTVFGENSMRIVQVDEFDIEAEPQGTMLLMMNHDKPGILGAWSSTLGKYGVNIARVNLARQGDIAMALVNVDSDVSEQALLELSSLPSVQSARRIKL